MKFFTKYNSFEFVTASISKELARMQLLTAIKLVQSAIENKEPIQEITYNWDTVNQANLNWIKTVCDKNETEKFECEKGEFIIDDLILHNTLEETSSSFYGSMLDVDDVRIILTVN